MDIESLCYIGSLLKSLFLYAWHFFTSQVYIWGIENLFMSGILVVLTVFFIQYILIFDFTISKVANINKVFFSLMISLIPPCCTILYIICAQISIAYNDKQDIEKLLATLKNRKCNGSG